MRRVAVLLRSVRRVRGMRSVRAGAGRTVVRRGASGAARAVLLVLRSGGGGVGVLGSGVVLVGGRHRVGGFVLCVCV